jgi:aspartate carbamoyltransferase catalytic subunit
MWPHRHLLGIDGLSAADVIHILDHAEASLALSREPVKKATTLRGKTIINLFLEASTRTRSSFELAGKRLSADVVNVSPSTSSISKGETLLDTVKNLEAMGADAIVLRHPASGAARFVAERIAAAVVNAGDGTHEHPTQALLDAFTIRKRKRHGGDLRGMSVAICGDVLHSRVARSNALLLGKLGVEVRLCAPGTMMPLRAEVLGPTVKVVRRIDEAVEGADVVMMLRIQSERFGGAMLASTREYSRAFGLSARVLDRAKPDAIVMHPGPIHRGVELDPALADGPRSVILDQVEAGVAVRMAVLELVVSAPAGPYVAAAAS